MRMHLVLLAPLLVGGSAATAGGLAQDTIPTAGGTLEVTFVGHGSLIFTWHGTVVHVDPYSKLADYATLPKAHLVLLTHAHRDHLDPPALAAVRTDRTVIIAAPACAGHVEGATIMPNGETRTVLGLTVEAVPAYNLVHMRSDGVPYHPKGEGNGYVLTFADSRVYVAGDTENTPEMKALRDVAVAFLPMNVPYTMTPEMVADAARAFRPRILYPYHFGDTDPQLVVALLAGERGIEVRIRPMR